MITKEQFIKRMSLIQNFHSEQETLSVLIEKVIDGYAVVTMGDYLVAEMRTMIQESMGLEDNNDILDWWLYEDVDKVIYENDGTETSIRTLEELYVYLTL